MVVGRAFEVTMLLKMIVARRTGRMDVIFILAVVESSVRDGAQ